MLFKRPNSKREGLPAGQRPIDRILRWGVDHPTIGGPIPRRDLANWVLMIEGEVEQPVKLNWTDFLQYPRVELVRDFHCVEGWSVLNCKWEGVSVKHIIDVVKPKPDAKFVTFECEDYYSTSLPVETLLAEEAILAYRLNGEELADELGGPLRLFVPDKYAYKSAMWLKRIKFTIKKETGYWEENGYSDSADVWKNDRYSRWRL